MSSVQALLLGSPRSGTTWLAKIIDSDPSVLYRHEPDMSIVRADIPFVPRSDELDLNLGVARTYLEMLFRERSPKSSASRPGFPKSFRSGSGQSMHRAYSLAVKALERVKPLAPAMRSTQIPDFISPNRESQVRLRLIKSVSSLCRAQLFSQAMPGIKIVHIVRHPCAYVASTLRGNREGHLNDSAYLDTLAAMENAAAHDLTMDRLQSMLPEGQLAARWLLQNEKVADEMAGNPNYLRVIYEDLCANPMQEVERLFAFLGLTVTDQTRNFVQSSSSGKSGSQGYFDVNRDSAKAAESWMSELSPQQIDAIRETVIGSSLGDAFFG